MVRGKGRDGEQRDKRTWMWTGVNGRDGFHGCQLGVSYILGWLLRMSGCGLTSGVL